MLNNRQLDRWGGGGGGGGGGYECIGIKFNILQQFWKYRL